MFPISKRCQNGEQYQVETKEKQLQQYFLMIKKIELVKTEHRDPKADDSGTVCIILVIIYIQCALIESEKIGNAKRILCDPVALFFYVCMSHSNILRKKKKKKKKYLFNFN